MAMNALGGLVISLVSISITIANTTWQASERYFTAFERRFTEPFPIDSVESITLAHNACRTSTPIVGYCSLAIARGFYLEQEDRRKQS